MEGGGGGLPLFVLFKRREDPISPFYPPSSPSSSLFPSKWITRGFKSHLKINIYDLFLYRLIHFVHMLSCLW